MTARGVIACAALGVCLTTVGFTDSAAAARFGTVPGESARVGSGTTYRFTVEVQRSIQIDRQGFAEQVEGTLLNRRGWTRSGRVAFKRVDRRGNTRVMLAKPRTVDRLCYPLPTNRTYSCQTGDRVVLNLRRWRNAVSHWPATVRNYRRMLVNHEMGHRIGHGHRNCPGTGKRAPVMQQQSISLQGCRANWWPKRRELRLTAGASAGAAATGSRDRRTSAT